MRTPGQEERAIGRDLLALRHGLVTMPNVRLITPEILPSVRGTIPAHSPSPGSLCTQPGRGDRLRVAALPQLLRFLHQARHHDGDTEERGRGDGEDRTHPQER